MVFHVKNITGGQFNPGIDDDSVNGTLVWQIGETKVLSQISPELAAIIEAGTSLISTENVAPFSALPTLPQATDANGTAVVASAGTVAIPAVTDLPSAANAIATLVALSNAQTLQINALVARLAGGEANAQTLGYTNGPELYPTFTG